MIERAQIAILAFAVGVSLWMASSAQAGCSADANTTNWVFNQTRDSSTDVTRYISAVNALAAKYSQSTQAWNEGGTTGVVNAGPFFKYGVFAGLPSAQGWTQLKAEVPAPGVTNAYGLAGGAGLVQPAKVIGGITVLPIIYKAAADADAVILGAVAPGGFGHATGTLFDPDPLDIPQPTSDTTNDLEAFCDMSGSSITYDPGGSGSVEFNMTLEGASEYSSPLFDYQVSNGPTGFSSTLTTAPGVTLYLNDDANSQEEDDDSAGDDGQFTTTPVSASYLKSVLDSYETPTGWDPGSNEILVGMDVPISNSDAGLGTDTDGSREFEMDTFDTAQAYDAMPEPSCVALLVGGSAITLMRRRGRDSRVMRSAN